MQNIEYRISNIEFRMSNVEVKYSFFGNVEISNIEYRMSNVEVKYSFFGKTLYLLLAFGFRLLPVLLAAVFCIPFRL
jgi:hypothetical protein